LALCASRAQSREVSLSAVSSSPFVV